MRGGQALPSIQPWFSRSQPWLSRSQPCACTRSLGRTSRRRGLEKLPEPHLYWTERNASCFPLFQDHHSSSLSAKVRSLVHPAGHRALPSSPWLTQNATSGASSGAAHACPLLGSRLSEGWGGWGGFVVRDRAEAGWLPTGRKFPCGNTTSFKRTPSLSPLLEGC